MSWHDRQPPRSHASAPFVETDTEPASGSVQALVAGPGVEVAQPGQFGGLGRGGEPALPVAVMAAAGPGQKALQVPAFRLQWIGAEGDQVVEDLEVGAPRALAGGEREVAGEVGKPQLPFRHQLTGLDRRQPVGMPEKKAAGGPRSKRSLHPLQRRGRVVEFIGAGSWAAMAPF